MSGDGCPNLLRQSGCTVIVIGTSLLDVRADTKFLATREFCPFCVIPTSCQSTFLIYAIIRSLIRAGQHLFGITLGEDRINLSAWISDLAEGLRQGCLSALPSTKLLPCYRHFQTKLDQPSTSWSKRLNNASSANRSYIKSRLDLLHACGSTEMITACFPFALTDMKKRGESAFAEFFRGKYGPGSPNGLMFHFNASGIYGVVPDNQSVENLFRIFQGGGGGHKDHVLNRSCTFHSFIKTQVPRMLFYHSHYRQYCPRASSLSTATKHPDKMSLAVLALMGSEDVFQVDGNTWLVNSPAQIGNLHSEERRMAQEAVTEGDISSPPMSLLHDNVLDKLVSMYSGYCVVRVCGTGPRARLHKKLKDEHSIKYICETCSTCFRHLACPATFLVSSINGDLPHDLQCIFAIPS